MPNGTSVNREVNADCVLAQRIANQDLAALECLMRHYNQRLFRSARSILKNDQDAEEAVQDAYLSAWLNISSYRAESQLSTWLTRIVINQALMRRRKQQRRAAIVPIVPQTEAEEVELMPYDTTDTPEHRVERDDVRHLIERNIDDLPDGFRHVFVLRALEDLSVEETAQCLNIPEATVRSRFFRARAQLREALAREMDMNVCNAFSFDGQRCDRIVVNVLARIHNQLRERAQIL